MLATKLSLITWLFLKKKKDGEIPYTVEFCGACRSKQIKDNKNENKNMCKHQVI